MQIAMDPNYDPTHKASSITSTTSTNSWDTVPSLATASVCDIDSPLIKDQLHFEESLYNGDRDFLTMSFKEMNKDQSTFINNSNNSNNNNSNSSNFLNHYFIEEKPNDKESNHKINIMHNTESTPIYLHQSHEITIPHTPTLSNESNTIIKNNDKFTNNNDDDDDQENDDDYSSSILSKRSRQSRELLTEDEKRANHIASEQKRRNTIRNGFKEMTEIIPTLKNINNSKSTILFKAVEYIKHLDKRNRGLREKLNALQIRLEVEGRMNGLIRTPYHLLRRQQPYNNHYLNDQQNKKSRSNSTSHLPPETIAALIAHKNQQKQLELLQEQLKYQQELLTKHNIPTNNHSRHLSIEHRRRHPSSPLYNSISIPNDHSIHRSSVNNHVTSSSSSTSSTPYHPHHRSSAPALVMPNMIEDSWKPNSTLNAPSFNIPADE
ncbi:unnamed protein product [Cunninghamella blakesleeana]